MKFEKRKKRIKDNFNTTSRRFILFYELKNKSYPFTLWIEEQDLIKRFIGKQNMFDYVHDKDQLLYFFLSPTNTSLQQKPLALC